jgi:hypothetical protein
MIFSTAGFTHQYFAILHDTGMHMVPLVLTDHGSAAAAMDGASAVVVAAAVAAMAESKTGTHDFFCA